MLLTLKEFCKELKISYSTARRWIVQENIPIIQSGFKGTIKIEESEIEKLKERMVKNGRISNN
jgi:excisionase family DNA binding protein